MQHPGVKKFSVCLGLDRKMTEAIACAFGGSVENFPVNQVPRVA